MGLLLKTSDTVQPKFDFNGRVLSRYLILPLKYMELEVFNFDWYVVAPAGALGYESLCFDRFMERTEDSVAFQIGRSMLFTSAFVTGMEVGKHLIKQFSGKENHRPQITS